MSADSENPITYTTFNSWAQCSNNVILHYIGHGSPNGVSMSDGRVWSGYAVDLYHTVLMSVSCNGFYDPYKRNVLSDRAQVFLSGITTLGIGISEECSSAYLEDAIDCKDLNEAYYKHIQGDLNCDHNQEWGFYSDGHGPVTLQSSHCGSAPQPAPVPAPYPVPAPVPAPVAPPSGDSCFPITNRDTCLSTTDSAGHLCMWCTDMVTYQHLCTYTETEKHALQYFTCETQ